MFFFFVWGKKKTRPNRNVLNRLNVYDACNAKYINLYKQLKEHDLFLRLRRKFKVSFELIEEKLRKTMFTIFFKIFFNIKKNKITKYFPLN